MGRKERHDIDYFPFFVKDGRTLFILEGKYQCLGTGFFTNVFRFLSRTPDHHFQLKDDADKLYFFANIKCDEERSLAMIEIMVTTGKLDKDLWNQEKVIASEDFLESIQEAYRKRSNPCITIDEIKAKYKITTGRNTQGKGKPAEEIQPQGDVDGITSSDNPQSKVKETKGKETKPYSTEFLTFYESYPRKKAPDAAWKAWKNRNGDRPALDILLKAIENQKKSDQWQREGGQFIPHPATWLNQGRWADEVSEPEGDLDAWARKKQAEMEARGEAI